MRIKIPELTFDVYNVGLTDATTKIKTFLESCMLQLSKDVCIFFVASSNQKLLARLCIQLTSLPRGFDNFEKINVLITFDRQKLQ